MKQDGFSLIELMLVVAIIGLLASIAIPNFQIMTEKARQVEAKSNLSGIYTAEQAFHAEFSTYSSEFDQIGFSFSGDMHYMIGFSNAFPSTNPAAPPHPAGGNCCWNACQAVGVVAPQLLAGGCAASYLSAVSWTCDIRLGAPANFATAFVAAQSFTAGASAVLNKKGTSDMWFMTDQNKLTNVQNGL